MICLGAEQGIGVEVRQLGGFIMVVVGGCCGLGSRQELLKAYKKEDSELFVRVTTY
jgi:hypothetical protein